MLFLRNYIRFLQFQKTDAEKFGYVQKEEISKHTAIMMSGMKAEQEKVMRNLKMSGKTFIPMKQNGIT